MASRDGEPIIRSLIPADQPAFKLQENYFKPPVGKKDIFLPPEGFPSLVARYTVKELSLFWNFFGGSDFEGGGGGRAATVAPVSSSRKSDLEGWRAGGGKGRDHSTLVSLCVNKLRFQHEQYPGERARPS